MFEPGDREKLTQRMRDRWSSACGGVSAVIRAPFTLWQGWRRRLRHVESESSTTDTETLRAIYAQRYQSYHFFAGFSLTTATFMGGGYLAFAAVVREVEWTGIVVKVTLVLWPLIAFALSITSIFFSATFCRKFLRVQRDLGMAEPHLTNGRVLTVISIAALIFATAFVCLGADLACQISDSPTEDKPTSTQPATASDDHGPPSNTVLARMKP